MAECIHRWVCSSGAVVVEARCKICGAKRSFDNRLLNAERPGRFGQVKFPMVIRPKGAEPIGKVNDSYWSWNPGTRPLKRIV